MVDIDSLAIEVTRRCNMQCKHCLRGDAQNEDMRFEHINALMRQVNYIGVLTFTGGEPSLNPDAMFRTLRACKNHNVTVGSFYVVTNGKTVSDEFILALLRWYDYCQEPEMCVVALSNDMFHEPIPAENLRKLRALSFFNEKEKAVDFAARPMSLIRMGRAADFPAICGRDQILPSGEELDLDVYGNAIYINGETISLTVNGEILLGCDYDYAQTDSIYLCEARDLEKTARNIYADPNREVFPKRICA